MRVACHASADLSLMVGAEPLRTATCRPGRGFQWLKFPVDALGVHEIARIAVHVPPYVASSSEKEWRVALDGVAVTDPQSEYSAVAKRVSLVAVVLSAARFSDAGIPYQTAAPGSISLVASNGFTKAVGITAATSDTPALTAYSSRNSLVYRWNGPSGRYIVSGSAWISGTGSALELLPVSGHGLRVAVYDPAAVTPTTVTAQRTLQTGQLFAFRAILPNGDPDASAAFMHAQVSSLSPSSVTGDGAGDETFSWNFTDSPTWFLPKNSIEGATPQSGISAASSLNVELSARDFRNAPTQVSLQVDASGNGSGLATLNCQGAPPLNFVLRSPDAVSAITGRRINGCKVTLRLGDPGLSITSLKLIARGTTVAPRVAERWLPKGDYDIRSFSRSGKPMVGAVAIDGRPVRQEIYLPSNGWHGVRIARTAGILSTIEFQPRGWQPRTLAPVQVNRTATVRWRVRTGARTTLEAAVFPDGSWRLISKRKAYSGTRCDLVNTCFDAVEPGDYQLMHRWPPSTSGGFGLSLIVWVLGLTCAALSLWPCAAASIGRQSQFQQPMQRLAELDLYERQR